MMTKVWKTKGKMLIQLHKAWRKADHDWTEPFLTLSVFVERPGAHGSTRRIEHTITDADQAERLIAGLQEHVDKLRRGLALTAQPAETPLCESAGEPGGSRMQEHEPAMGPDGPVDVLESTFVIGDQLNRDDFETYAFTELDVRPIYGPKNLNGGRSIVGYIRHGVMRAETVDPLEQLAAMLAFADENMLSNDVVASS